VARVAFDHVTKVYPGPVVAVDDLSVEVGDGEFLILVGPSGCGKSTALRMVAGLEKISGGSITIDGAVVNDVPPRDRDIAMVFQNYALYPHMTVERNLAFGLRQHRTHRDEVRRRVEEISRMLGIEDLLRRRPGQLSGGQRQRVAMGRAIVREPEAFLMDEPLSNLDAKLRVQTRSEIKHLQQQVGTTTVYVTHDQVEAMTMGDRVAVMNEGVLEQVGDTRTVYEHPTNTFVAGFIGSPAMSFATLGARRDGDEVTVSRGDLSLTLPGTAFPNGAPAEITIGVRPEHAHLWRDGSGLVGPVDGRVQFVEMLGREALLGVSTDDETRFTVFVDADSPARLGDPVRFGVEPGRTYLFDPHTTQAIGTA